MVNTEMDFDFHELGKNYKVSHLAKIWLSEDSDQLWVGVRTGSISLENSLASAQKVDHVTHRMT